MGKGVLIEPLSYSGMIRPGGRREIDEKKNTF